MRTHFLIARLLSGALFLLMVTLLVFPVGLGAASLDRMFNGNTGALFIAMAILSLCFSAMSLGLSAWMPSGDAAVWIGFWLIVIFAMVGGAILPENMLPVWVKNVGLWSPIRSAMRLLAGTIFNFNQASYFVDVLKIAFWGLIGTVSAFIGFARRAAV